MGVLSLKVLCPAESKQALSPARIALLGTGTVGTAVLRRIEASEFVASHLRVLHVANSRYRLERRAGMGWHQAGPIQNNLVEAELDRLPERLGRGHGTRIIIDATASDLVAERHGQWLSSGVHVVTACKLGQGTSLGRWREISIGCAQGRVRYGDSATVGAGLPILSTIRSLREGGDRVHSIAGVLSGSMAWICHEYDGLRPFSTFVRAAHLAGLTEPDAREDLSGEDVRRKLLILSRAAGFQVESEDVAVSSLVSPLLAAVSRSGVDELLSDLDAPMRERFASAYRVGEKLRFIGRLNLQGNSDGADGSCATVAIESVAATHPLAGGSETDNVLAIWSDRYSRRPLVIQGPGAGADVTAAALLDDALRIATNRA